MTRTNRDIKAAYKIPIETLEPKFQRICETIRSEMKRLKVPGAAIGVYLRQWITGEGADEACRVLAPLSLYRDFGSKEKLK